MLPEEERLKEIRSLTKEEIEQLNYSWKFWGRPDQIAPEGDWSTWLILAGRGWGKTRAGSEWIKSIACGNTPLAKGRAHRIALVAETAADARDVLVEGDSGILSVHHPAFRPEYEPSKRRLTWPNGAVATMYNAVEPDQLRGPQHDAAWCDELAKWRYAQETWDQLQFGLRLGDNPVQMITTTPRPIPILKEIMNDPSTVVTKGNTMDNVSNLAPKFLKQIKAKYEGTRLGRQELNAEILDDIPGALWTRKNLDDNRVGSEELPDMQRVVIAIDPAASDARTRDLYSKQDKTAETGIIVAALGVDGKGYIIEDLSCSLGPLGWARRAISGYQIHHGDAIVVEKNNGGAMVTQNIRSVDENVPVIEVWASRGKVTRAEPIAALYEQNRISHVGTHATLEDQMVLFTQFGIEGDTTADRVDALVWALTELFPSLISKEINDFDFDEPFNLSGDGAWLGA